MSETGGARGAAIAGADALKRIVVGVDFSERGEVALAHAEGLARSYGAELVLVHASGVAEDGMYVYQVAGRFDEPWKAYVASRRDHAREQLRERAAGCRRHGVDVSAKLVDGFADAALVETAADLDGDLLVVGTHGRTGVERWLLGSVAERVVRTAERPVLVARDGAPPDDGYHRILVPVDLSPPSVRALTWAKRLLAPAGEIVVLHAWQPPAITLEQAPPAEVHTAWKERAEEATEEFVGTHGEGLNVRVHVVEGVATRCIESHLEADEYDLVAMGSHGRRGVRRLILGSVAEQTVRYADRSVLVVHG